MTEINKSKFKNKYYKDLPSKLQIAFLIWLIPIALALAAPSHPTKTTSESSVLSANSTALPPDPVQVFPSSLSLSATSYAALDVSTGKFLLQKNAYSLHAPASTAKLMMAWVSRRKCQLGQVVTVSESLNEGAVLGVRPGQRFTVQNLLYALLIPSNNDVAVALADGCFGSQEKAVEQMNTQTQTWKLYDTHFADVHGLDNPGNYSTAHDLALLGKLTMTDPMLSQIVATKSYDIASLDGQTYHLQSTNQLLGKLGVTGVKTGSTDFAGENFIGRASVSGHQVITVVLGSNDRFADTGKLLLEISRIYRWEDSTKTQINTKT